MSNVKNGSGETTKIVFEKHVVAFIDILGFKNFIKEEEKFRTEKFDDLLKEISENPIFKDELEHNISLPEEMGLVCRHISDSFIITAPCLDNQKIPALYAVSIKAIQIFQVLLSIGLSSRGGIAVGKLYIKDNNLFGSAFIDAYETEQKAIYPRILLNEAAEKELGDVSKKYPRYSFFASMEGKVFLDTFFDLSNVTSDNLDIKTKLNKFKKCIEENLEKFFEPDIRKKWVWIALHFNAVLDYYKVGIDKISIEQNFPIQLNSLNLTDPNWMAKFIVKGHKVSDIRTKQDK